MKAKATLKFSAIRPLGIMEVSVDLDDFAMRKLVRIKDHIERVEYLARLTNTEPCGRINFNKFLIKNGYGE